jgi:hypothetical protein
MGRILGEMIDSLSKYRRERIDARIASSRVPLRARESLSMQSARGKSKLAWT